MTPSPRTVNASSEGLRQGAGLLAVALGLKGDLVT